MELGKEMAKENKSWVKRGKTVQGKLKKDLQFEGMCGGWIGV